MSREYRLSLLFWALALTTGALALGFERPHRLAQWLAFAAFAPPLALVLAPRCDSPQRRWLTQFAAALGFILVAITLAVGPRLAFGDPLRSLEMGWIVRRPVSYLLWPVFGVSLVGLVIVARVLGEKTGAPSHLLVSLAVITAAGKLVAVAGQRLAASYLEAEIWLLYAAVAILCAAAYRAGSNQLHRVWPILLLTAAAADRLSWWYVNPTVSGFAAPQQKSLAGGQVLWIVGSARGERLQVNWLFAPETRTMVGREIRGRPLFSTDFTRVVWWECRPASVLLHELAVREEQSRSSKDVDRLDACRLYTIALHRPLASPLLMFESDRIVPMALSPSGSEIALATRDALEIRATADARILRSLSPGSGGWGLSPEYVNDDIVRVTVHTQLNSRDYEETFELRGDRSAFEFVSRRPLIRGEIAASGDRQILVGEARLDGESWIALYDGRSGEPLTGLIPILPRHGGRWPVAAFLGDSRIAVACDDGKTAELRVFTSEGTPVRTIALPGRLRRLGNEQGEDCLEVFVGAWGRERVVLVDLGSR